MQWAEDTSHLVNHYFIIHKIIEFHYFTGDKILVAIKGEKQKAIIVGVKKKQPKNIPSCDTNNIVLIDEAGSPLGTRISLPIPIMLRTILKKKNLGVKGVDYTKLLAIAKTFV